ERHGQGLERPAAGHSAGRRRLHLAAGGFDPRAGRLPGQPAIRDDRRQPAEHRPVAEPAGQLPGAEGLDRDDRDRSALAGAATAADDDDDRHDPLTARRLRVAILAGGRSSEHEISLASARSVAGALDQERYEIAEVSIARNGRWELGTGRTTAETLPVPYEGGPL